MKFFTPDLYLRFNSRDRDVVEKAHEEWEEAIVGYQRHLAAISARLTPSTRAIAETLCLHDAEYLGLAVSRIPDSSSSLATLWTRQGAASRLLIYILAAESLIQQASENWPYSDQDVHWLYDEFDVSEQGIAQHEVLLSDGRVLRFQFHEVQQIEHSIRAPSAVA